MIVRMKRNILENSFVAPPSGASPLKVDREAGVIFGVKILGRFSPNCHGIRGVTEGTEYTVDAMKKACGLYEGTKIYCNHPEKKDAAKERRVNESFGKISNIRVEDDSVRGDLHYLKSHPMAASVVEDVERGIGIYGLSHNADAKATRVVNGKLIVEEIGTVFSVDLVDRPATNKNLWESSAMKTTLKKLIEGLKFKANRAKWAAKLCEADSVAADAVNAEMEMDEPAESTPEDAMTNGFRQAVYSIIDQILAGDVEVAEGLSKVKELIVSHDKLTAADEPAEPVEEEDDEDKKDEKLTKESIDKLVQSAVKTALKEAKLVDPKGGKPKSGAPLPKKTTESASTVPTDPKAFASSIME
jgi:hypothetical protein